ncbi:MAG: hypothetical protein M1812_000001 [Candelaria pacifica]|nr:MAG: hypothetical protein M1812_000001 [Candelaria pacifica]
MLGFERELALLGRTPSRKYRTPVGLEALPEQHLKALVEYNGTRDLRQVSENEREHQDFNVPPSSPNEFTSILPSQTSAKRKLSVVEKEPLPINCAPAVTMNQSNFEDSGIWMTRNTKKQLAQITAGGDGDSAHLPSRTSKGQMLPRDMARKNPNAFGGAGVGVSGGLDYVGKDFGKGNDAASSRNDETSEGDSSSVSYHDEITDSPDDDYSVTTEGEPTSKPKSVLRAHVAKQQSNVDTLYKDWVTKKERILQLIASPGYSSLSAASTHASASSDYTRKLLETIPDGYNVSRENGLYVFSPTLKVYQDFPRFLAKVEEIAGREHGVVKIIVPKESLPAVKTPSASVFRSAHTSPSNASSSVSHPNPTEPLLGSATHMMEVDPLPNQSAFHQPSSTLTASGFTMCLHENVQSDIWPVYKIKSESVGAVSPIEWRATIEQHRQTIAQGWGMNEHDKDDAWKSGQWETMNAVAENAMIESFEAGTEKRLYAMDNDASTELREALCCHDMKLDDLPGNILMRSTSRMSGIHTPYFYVSNSPCTPFAIHIEDYAAYSINYLHSGAPKCWRVVRPEHHRDVEEFLNNHTNPPERQLSARSGRTPCRPPQCSQFLRHHPMYIPKTTMDMLDITYTTVVQHQGEMVITFPFAYHEGWNTGPNIAEAIGYASERWAIFMREGLYQNCHKLNCRQKPLKMDFGFLRGNARAHKKSRTQSSGVPRKKKESGPSTFATDNSATTNARTSKLLQPASLYMTPLQTPTPASSGRNSIDPSPTGIFSAHAQQQHALRQGYVTGQGETMDIGSSGHRS